VFHLIPHRLAVDRQEVREVVAQYEAGSLSLEDVAKRLCPKAYKAFNNWVCKRRGDSGGGGGGECGKWVVLVEVIGYTLYPKYDLHKAIMLVGSGSNGKST